MFPEVYVVIAAIMVMFLYSMHQITKIFKVSDDLSSLKERMDRLEEEILECFRLEKDELSKISNLGDPEDNGALGAK